MGLAALALWALLCAHGPAAAAPTCNAPTPRVTVTETVPAPTIDNTLTQPQLQQIAAGHHGRALGLYRAAINGHLESEVGLRWDASEACLWISSVTLRVELADRRIWVIRERKPGTCPYEVVLAHERKHQATDEAVVDLWRGRFEAALAKRARALGVVRVSASEREAAQKRMTRALKEVFQREMRALQDERERRQSAIDTPVEYRRVAAACDPSRKQ